ncbi:chemotaxis protein CheD [Paludisphaera borealis]|uniref:Probable chemoreceptor glutamine deamidase CheD n=1 Tax=Paludisphaera borealis TaxID=1387353 RepID=A0A1U7CRR6_9BACT|nr:chemotaxis protein CheD [Paludisphaera borealis]APW61586.1 Chemoreceptor glutamine deamidase CheD [Paludisphaera borealis]
MTIAPDAAATVSVAIGQWAVAGSPSKIRTLLGSCVGVVLYDRGARVGGLAHVVLPRSRGAVDHPGKYADTAIPALIADLDRALRGKSAGRLVAKLAGGASMFTLGPSANPTMNIGRSNQEAVEQILADLRIPIIARDLGGETGRHVTLDTATGLVVVRTPGADEKEL